MLLSHDQIIAICEIGVVEGWKESAVNAASLDIHLGNKIMVSLDSDHIVDYRKRERLHMREYEIDDGGFLLRPDDFILAHTQEIFNLPNYIVAEYRLKSSMARIGLEHLYAGYCDPGWHGSALTLEFKNISKQTIRLRPGDPIGQMIFFHVAAVSDEQSYAIRGRYNKDGHAAVGIKE
jgi:dCTP deaminase